MLISARCTDCGKRWNPRRRIDQDSLHCPTCRSDAVGTYVPKRMALAAIVAAGLFSLAVTSATAVAESANEPRHDKPSGSHAQPTSALDQTAAVGPASQLAARQ